MTNDHHLRNHIIAVTVSLIILLLIGLTGYTYLEGWDWFDALYMTFISFSTVGYQEIKPLGHTGRLFTMAIIFFGMIVLAMLSATVTSWFIRNELLIRRKQLKMKKQIKSLKDHIIICGAGDTGKKVVEEFVRFKKPFVLIEEKSIPLLELQEKYPDILTIQGDATKDEVLLEANIEQAHALITALPLDADNLFVVVSARALNPNLLIISRSVNASTEQKLYNAGANYVISPNTVEGIRMASVILRPTVVSFIEVISQSEGLSLRMEEIDIPKGSPFHGKTLKEIQIPQKTGLMVLAIKKAQDSRWTFNPSSNFLLHENDQIIVLGETEKINKLQSMLKSDEITVRQT
ncbi:MAG TPA: potassium channel protein [Caldithrix abyssi]|uniref:Potassium channel protein n=1 Tax=Caldithrix abyssi TaxID=187145 RepID=A0A7V5PQ88_CALAY|nr:potassium channel protein [Caldithrix abyssi]